MNFSKRLIFLSVIALLMMLLTLSCAEQEEILMKPPKAQPSSVNAPPHLESSSNRPNPQHSNQFTPQTDHSQQYMHDAASGRDEKKAKKEKERREKVVASQEMILGIVSGVITCTVLLLSIVTGITYCLIKNKGYSLSLLKNSLSQPLEEEVSASKQEEILKKPPKSQPSSVNPQHSNQFTPQTDHSQQYMHDAAS